MQRAWYQICAAANLAFVRLDAPRRGQSQRAESAASVFCLERNVRTAQHPQCAVMQLLFSYATPNRRSLPMQQNKISFKTPPPRRSRSLFFMGFGLFAKKLATRPRPNYKLRSALCCCCLPLHRPLYSVLCTTARAPCYCTLHAKPKPATGHWPLQAAGHWPLATGHWWLVGLVLVRDHGAAGGWSGWAVSALWALWATTGHPSMALSVTPSVVRWCRSWPL
jgi:hypothetical protein